jgi:hypothetical protein
MNIDTSLRELGSIDVTPLQQAILAQDDAAWLEQTHRQQTYDVHYNTQSIVLVFCDGWPDMTVSKEPGWDRLSDVAVPLMHGIIDKFYPKGGTIIRAMAAKLVAGGRITPHIDSHASFRHSHRIHIPITSNSGVRFMIDGRPYQFEVGQAYEINNQKRHSVMNRGKEDRITFIFDYVPPDIIDRTPGGPSGQS